MSHTHVGAISLLSTIVEVLSYPDNHAVVQHITSDVLHPFHSLGDMGIRCYLNKTVNYAGIAYLEWISATDYDSTICSLKLFEFYKILTETKLSSQLCHANRIICRNFCHNRYLRNVKRIFRD